MLIDHAKIYTAGGKGGNGCQSLYKDLLNRRGVPDGGSGGDGGNIVIQSDTNLHTLLDFKYNQHYRASSGGHGSSNKKAGRNGKDLVIKVPVGTIIIDAGNSLVIKDLSRPLERVVAAKGGTGGKGNSKFRMATKGEPGESRVLIFDLKIVADAGIIGLPNAGKSTLVSRISKAHTKIAPYPFTTKSPILGVVELDEDAFVVADMPGLIEGAHEGRGLGDKFLRHVERTKILVHMVDMAPLDGSEPLDNFFLLEKELKLYSKEVYNKPRIIALNKMDMESSKENLKRFKKGTEQEVYPISALKGTGLKGLVKAIYKEIKDVKDQDNHSNY